MYQLEVKDSNTRKVLMVLREKRELTRQDIAHETGMSIPTVTNNIVRLVKEGVVEEAHVLASRGGRKPQAVKFLPNAKFSFGVQISSDHYSAESKVRIVLVNLDTAILHDELFDYSRFADIDAIMEEINRRIGNILKEKGISASSVLGIGVSLPGPVHEKKKLLRWAPNIDPKFGMNALNFGKYEDLFEIPLYVENEANAAAYAELMNIMPTEKRNLIYLAVNRGISAGIIVRGHVYKGSSKRAGEFGHMAVAEQGTLCTCGNRDCWELYAATGVLIRSYNERSAAKISNTREFRTCLKAGDPVAQAVWESYIDYFAKGIRNILLFFDPDALIIGGEISQFKDELITPLKERIFSKESYYGNEVFDISVSALEERSSVLGAAFLPLQMFFYGKRRII